jgi:hypothetical protein
MDLEWASPARGRHVYVVLRYDSYIADPVEAIIGTKAYLALAAAQAEADRLNALNADKGARYFVRVARLRDDSDR